MSEERDPDDDGQRGAEGPGETRAAGGEATATVLEATRTGDDERPRDATAATPPEPSGRGHAVARWLDVHRGRIARVFFVSIAVLVLLDLGGTLPADVELRLPLGAEAADVVALDIELRDADGETLHEVRLRTPEGAPRVVPETVSLAPGHYVVVVDAERRDGSRFSLEGPLEAPAEGAVTVPLRAAY